MRALGPFVLCVVLPALVAVGSHYLIDWLI
jgi:hypothetical protein